MAENMFQTMYKGPDAGFGENGIDGLKHSDIVGWNNVTVGIGANIEDMIFSQNGNKVFDPNLIGALEPIRLGKFIVKWLKYPPFFNEQAARYLKFFLEDTVRALEGIPDNQMTTIDGTPMGAVQQEHTYPGTYKQAGKEVTLTTFTCSGDGLGKLIRYWQYGLSDPSTGISTMYGKNLRFLRSNYSGSLIFVLLGPTARAGDIEFSCMWHELWPTSPDGHGIFNPGTMGDVGNISERQVTFTGLYQWGPEIDILAKYIVAGYGLGGQSFLDQLMPAYTYLNYIVPISGATTKEILATSVSSIAQADRINTTYYTDAVTEARDTMRDNAGVNTSLPSSQTHVDPIEQIKVLNTAIEDNTTATN